LNSWNATTACLYDYAAYFSSERRPYLVDATSG